MLKFSSDRDDLLALRMSLPIENKRSTAALEGMAVLNLMNKSTNTCSPKKATVSKSLELVSIQVLTKFWAFPLSDLWLLHLSFCSVTALKKSSSSLLMIPLLLSTSSACCLMASSTLHSMLFLTLATLVLLYFSNQIRRNLGWKAAASWHSSSCRRDPNLLSMPAKSASIKGLQ